MAFPTRTTEMMIEVAKEVKAATTEVIATTERINRVSFKETPRD